MYNGSRIIISSIAKPFHLEDHIRFESMSDGREASIGMLSGNHILKDGLSSDNKFASKNNSRSKLNPTY